MKRVYHLLTALAFLMTTVHCFAGDRVQLKEFRARLVGHRVFITAANDSMYGLSGWNFVKQEGETYTVDRERRPVSGVYPVPGTFVGSAGVIIAIQAQSPGSNADESYAENVDAIIKLDSGELLSKMLSSWQLSRELGTSQQDEIALESLRDRHKQEADELAKRLSGKTLFLTRNAHIYDLGLKLSEIHDAQSMIGTSGEIKGNSMLTPLPIKEVVYSGKYDYTSVLVVLPDGRTAQFLPGCILDTFTPEQMGCVFLTMPSTFTPHEVEAIRKGSFFVGMSRNALLMSMGYPEKQNNSSLGTDQYVYPGAYIYIGKNNKVVSFQN